MKADVLYRVSVIWRPFGAEGREERVHHYERGFGKDMTLGEQFDLLQVARDYRDGNLYPGGYHMGAVDIHVNDKLIGALEEMIRKRLSREAKVAVVEASLSQRVEASLADGEGSAQDARVLAQSRRVADG